MAWMKLSNGHDVTLKLGKGDKSASSASNQNGMVSSANQPHQSKVRMHNWQRQSWIPSVIVLLETNFCFAFLSFRAPGVATTNFTKGDSTSMLKNGSHRGEPLPATRSRTSQCWTCSCRG